MAIRLNGLAAPEWDTTAGEAATEALREMVLGKTVLCELDGSATYDRCAGVCYLLGADVAETLVAPRARSELPAVFGRAVCRG